MVYNATYDEGDITGATINIIVKAILTIGTLITILVIAVMWKAGKKAIK